MHGYFALRLRMLFGLPSSGDCGVKPWNCACCCCYLLGTWWGHNLAELCRFSGWLYDAVSVNT